MLIEFHNGTKTIDVNSQGDYLVMAPESKLPPFNAIEIQSTGSSGCLVDRDCVRKLINDFSQENQ